MEDDNVVYALYSSDGECGYIGVTSDPARRMREHRSRAKGGYGDAVYGWMRNKEGIEMRVLEGGIADSDRLEREASWIETLKPLANQMVRFEWTEDAIRRRLETRRSGAGFVISPEGRARISAANLGRTGHWLGKKMSREHVAGFSGERNGNAKLTNAQADEVRSRRSAGESVVDLMAEFAVSRKTIYRVSQGITYMNRRSS